MHPSYQLNDLLLLIGQCTVELAYLRARVTELEAKLKEYATSPNGTATLPGVEQLVD